MKLLTLPKKRINVNPEYYIFREEVEKAGLHTICQQAKCPNIFECFSKRRVTFLILGDTCSRGCSFCAVKKGKPRIVDEEEPDRLARFIKKFGIQNVVITSVCRDDLKDLGAEQFVRVISAVKELNRDIKIEVLIPDFRAKPELITKVIKAGPDVISHNLETVPRLTEIVRRGANYNLSLKVLKMIKDIDGNIITKSALLLGMGEKKEEVLTTITDIRNTGCDILVLGQYLRPNKDSWEVRKILTPDEFAYYKNYALELGFRKVFADTWARSSNCFWE
jgi:lipoic acid synthetase